MTSSKSPRDVFVLAWKLGCATLPEYSSPFSRKDFTLPQLFACLVLKHFMRQSYRGVEALLGDSRPWCDEIEMTEKVPDHKTINDAFDTLTELGVLGAMLEHLAACFEAEGLLRLDERPLAVDSTYMESHHVSRHFERRRAKSLEKLEAADAGATVPEPSAKQAEPPRPSTTRSATAKALPKLVLAVATACHLVLAASAATGMSGDQACLIDVLPDACSRAKVRQVVADAGFDSEFNHRLCRDELGVESLIPVGVGRPTDKPPSDPNRKLMRAFFVLGLVAGDYNQRWQVETVNSMIKRNYGSALSSRTAARREREMLLRALVHNLALPPNPPLA
jgi:hypothetical protein